MAEKRRSSEQASAQTLIVGVGASAGGLEALEEFFRSVPDKPGMAFVVVQHLSPTHTSQLPEIIAHYTAMPVHEITDGMAVDRDAIYVIPPAHALTILKGVLYLEEIADSRTTPVRIDNFFQSLAEDQLDMAVGVILSGSGTDGMLGLRSIKDYGGITLAQSPETARYDAMPRHAIDGGVVDLVAPAQNLPALLLHYHQNARKLPELEIKAAQGEDEYFSRILDILLKHTNHDFSAYKRNTVSRRIARRMVLCEISTLEAYVQRLEQSITERDTLFSEMLIGVTSFFRDPFAYDALREQVLPLILADIKPGQPIRVWVSGCSTGEEAYSLAMVCHDVLGADVSEDRLQLFATDINPHAIRAARQGDYPATVAADIPPHYLERYFTVTDDGYTVNSIIRKLIIFAEHNVLKDPPFSNLSLVSFRNVLIYLQPENQAKVLEIFHYALEPDGFLLLGTSEALGSVNEAWQVINPQAKIFRARSTSSSTRVVFEMRPSRITPYQGEHPMPAKPKDFRSAIDKLLLQEYVSPCVITSSEGDILYFHNRTGDFLEPAEGEARLNLLQMARNGLRMVLSTAFHKAVNDQVDVLYENVEVRTNGDSKLIHLIVHPIQKSKSLEGLVLVMFEEARQTPLEIAEGEDPDTIRDQRIAKLERELLATREFLQTTREELETANEDLKSMNEELQSANEELQSTNEELETSKEEVNSVNEELISANAELQAKIESMARARSDRQNLLNSVDVGIVFLDKQLNIQGFNPASKRIFNLIDSDIGRSISDITSTIDQSTLSTDVEAVIKTLTTHLVEVRSTDGNWYLMQIRPYRTVDDVINGVVMTFSDITQQKKTEATLQGLITELEEAHDYARGIINTIRHPFLVLDQNYKILSANASYYALFKLAPEQTINVSLFELGDGQWDIPELKDMLRNIVQTDKAFRDYVVEHDFRGLGHRTLALNGQRLEQKADNTILILLAFEDLSDGV